MDTEIIQSSWRESLEDIQSLGSTDQGVCTLGDLAAARRRHLGQFFTPMELVALLWKIASEAFDTAPVRMISLLDNSVGTGRLLSYATPERFRIAGYDIHDNVIQAVQAAADRAGFSSDLYACGMQDARPRHFDVAIINPPFSLHLESPNLFPYECTTYGKFGPQTSAQSDEYALAQALDAADVVVAIVPSSLAAQVAAGGVLGEDAKRLRGVLKLHRNAFSGEGAQVETSVLVFGADAQRCLGEIVVDDLASFAVPAFGLVLGNGGGTPKMRVIGLDDSTPAVTLDVTGNKAVRIVNKGRRLKLKFACGLVQAKVLNALYRERIYSTEDQKLPRGVKYAGQGLLDIQNLLQCADPMEKFEQLLSIIECAGGNPQPDSSVLGFLKNQIRQKPRTVASFGHWVFRKDTGHTVQATALKAVALQPSSWSSPVIKRGEAATLTRQGESWNVEKYGVGLQLTDEHAKRMFDMPVSQSGWVQIHPPMQTKFPVMAHELAARARCLGLDKQLWDFQFDDLIEVCMKPGGAVVGWQQGLGKARIAAAIILLRRIRNGLLVMPSYLLDEFTKRLDAAGIDNSLWKIIDCPEDINKLRQINIISYERLRRPLHSQTKRTYAKAMRHRFGLVGADEGERISNSQSDQSRALAQLDAPVQYIFSGTPIANYGKDMLPVGVYTVGDGVIGQPFGIRQPFLKEVNATSMRASTTGIDEFRERHVSLVWSTNEFADTLQDGAKREVPRIKNVQGYRDWVGTFVKRRLHREPEVESCVKIPDPILKTMTVEWDEDHLAYYLQVADDFAQWYRDQNSTQRLSNLMLLLARISAVEAAGNIPQRTPKTGRMWRGGMTSKQRAVVDLACKFTQAGEKTVVFAESPRTLEILRRALDGKGVESVLFHGELAKKARNTDLDRRWRYGSAPILLASTGTMQAGWDLYQGSKVIFANRSWSSREEDQAIRRLLRPQQTRDVEAWRVHLQGSIDCYQDQMVAWKASSAESGLDWGEPQSDDVPFLHLDTILGKFVEDLANLRGMKYLDLKDQLKKAA